MITIKEHEEIPLFDDRDYEVASKAYDLEDLSANEALIKTKERVQTHGEVFTPQWMVQKMLAEPSIQEKLNDLHATFLEPSAGEGAFLTEILHQKLNYVDAISSKRSWSTNALWAMMSIYGIELLVDNLVLARRSLMVVAQNHYQAFMQKALGSRTDFYKAMHYVIRVNIVQGNTLTHHNQHGELITFSHWWPTEDGLVQREEFTYQSLFQDAHIDSNTGEQMSLFDDFAEETSIHYRACPVTKVYLGEIES